MEENISWKKIFHGKKYFMEKNISWKKIFHGRKYSDAKNGQNLNIEFIELSRERTTRFGQKPTLTHDMGRNNNYRQIPRYPECNS